MEKKKEFVQNTNISLIIPFETYLPNQVGKKLNYVINCKLKKDVQDCQDAYYHQMLLLLFFVVLKEVSLIAVIRFCVLEY